MQPRAVACIVLIALAAIGAGTPSAAFALKSITVVNTTADESLSDNPEACEPEAGKPKSEKCALRAALELARLVVASGSSSQEVFVPKGTYVLSAAKKALPLGNFNTSSCVGGVECPVELVGESDTGTIVTGHDATPLIKAFDAADTVENLTLTEGKGATGGAIDNEGAQRLTVRRVHLTKNSATGEGGALQGNKLPLIVRESALSENIAEGRGGAIAGGAITLEDVSMTGNTSGESGGAIFNSRGGLSIVNSTAWRNTAPAAAFAYLEESTASLSYSTIASNENVGLGAAAITGKNASMTMTGSILSGNTPQQCNGTLSVEGLGANIVFGASTCGFTGTAPTGSDPLLGAPAATGFGTVLALGKGSPAINAGTAGCPETSGHDERGIARPQGPACDLGAWEAAADARVALAASPEQIVLGATQTLTATVSSAGLEAVQGVTLTMPLPAGATLISAPLGCSAAFAATTTVTCALGDLAAGQVVQEAVVVRPAHAGPVLESATVAAAGPDFSSADDSATIASSVLAPAPSPGGPSPGAGPGGPGASGPGSGSPPKGAATAKLIGSSFTVDAHGNLLVRVRCGGASKGGCVTALDLFAASGSLPAAASAVRKASLYARAHVTIAAGKTAFVHLHLSKAALKLLRKSHLLRVRALMSVHGTIATVSTSRYSLALKPAKKRR